jgi:transaldolase
MELFIDTMLAEEVKRISNIYPIKGITTNPIIFKKEFPDGNLETYHKTILNLTRLNKLIFVQPSGDTLDELITQGKELTKLTIRCDTYLKIPATTLGLETVKQLPYAKILATACMSWEQAMIFSQFENVKYIAFYWGGMVDKEIDAAAQIKKGIEATSRTDVKIMAAGLRDWNAVEQAMQVMPHAITITPSLFKEFDKSLNHPQTLHYCERFNSTYQKFKEK